MSRFARIVEDPEYDEPAVGEGWDDLLDGFVTVAEMSLDVVKKPQEDRGYYIGLDWGG
jgi:hypothetical protein